MTVAGVLRWTHSAVVSLGLLCLLSRRTKSGLDALGDAPHPDPWAAKSIMAACLCAGTKPPPDCDTGRRFLTPSPGRPFFLY